MLKGKSMMKIKRAVAGFISLVFLFGCFGGAFGEVRLPSVISDNMMLQRGQGAPIWGWAEPGEEVTVAIGDNRARARAGEEGYWRVTLAAMEASTEPVEMTVSGEKGSKITIKNILVGEVWLGSGQSNMEWPLINTTRGGEFVGGADLPNIRLFHVPHVMSARPANDVQAEWVQCSPETVKDFSAVLYHFGRNLHSELDVPVGLIESAFGGTKARPWIPTEGLASEQELKGYAEWVAWAYGAHEKAKTQAPEAFASWLSSEKQAPVGAAQNSQAEAYGDIEFQKGKAFYLAGLAKWLERAKRAAGEKEPIPAPPALIGFAGNPQDPTVTYNGMIHPLVPFAIRGVIWYQGESDVGAGMHYYYLMKGLIQGWRKVWNEGEFPFYYVQLAPYHYSKTFKHCKVEDLPLLWEAQAAALSVPNTGMAVTNDIGSVGDTHPRNKHDVGRRLALWALAGTYGREDVVFSGPLYDSYGIEEDKIRVRFNYTGSGLVTRDGKELTWFSIAGEDRKFVEARAEIEGDTVVVSSKEVPKPVAVRFGWDETAEPNLANKEGLPASSFRTDRW